jgi:peptide-methionine (R)-S-oxide reductase
MDSYKKTEEAIASLTPMQFRVTQEGATEHPGTGEHLNNDEAGIYVDIVSGELSWWQTTRLASTASANEPYRR